MTDKSSKINAILDSTEEPVDSIDLELNSQDVSLPGI